MDITRRGFFKLAAVLGTAGAFQIRLLGDHEPLAASESWIGMVRELEGYDLLRDEIILRHDIRTATEQLGVDHWLRSSGLTKEQARLKSVEMLASAMHERGIQPSELLPLSLPPGITGLYLS